MGFSLLDNLPTTPAFILDKTAILHNLRHLRALRDASGCKLLYSIKALPLSSVLRWAQPFVDGFSASSLFEACLAAEYSAGGGAVQLTTPGLKAEEMPALAALCSHISFNSFNHYQRFAPLLPATASAGLRVNPKMSFLSDDRFNPCRMHSKLGVDIAELRNFGLPQGVTGLHVHNIFSSTTLQPLQQTVAHLCELLHGQLSQLQWLNLGGGYLFDRIDNTSEFIEVVRSLRHDYGLQVYIEPGKAVVGNAGYLAATVIDSFVSDGMQIAVLDSSVNHHPELFEYQRTAELAVPQTGHGDVTVMLAGCTCLAGDLFGTYRLLKPLAIGDRVLFKNLGAYSLIKANRFNGYNLPDVYAKNEDGLQLLKHYTYHDYRSQWHAEINQENKP